MNGRVAEYGHAMVESNVHSVTLVKAPRTIVHVASPSTVSYDIARYNLKENRRMFSFARVLEVRKCCLITRLTFPAGCHPYLMQSHRAYGTGMHACYVALVNISSPG